MSFDWEELPGGRLKLSGELDINHAHQAWEVMCDVLGRGGDSVDLSGITEMDFTGVQLLLAAKRHAGAVNRAFVVVDKGPVVADVLQLLGVDLDKAQDQEELHGP